MGGNKAYMNHWKLDILRTKLPFHSDRIIAYFLITILALIKLLALFKLRNQEC